jgi:hypothetical protein
MMNRATHRRLVALETKQPSALPAVYRLILTEHEDEGPRIAALVAAGAKETDVFILRRIVSPPSREAA